MTQMCSASRWTRESRSGFSPAHAAAFTEARMARRDGRDWRLRRGLSAHILSLSTLRIRISSSPERRKVFYGPLTEDVAGGTLARNPLNRSHSIPGCRAGCFSLPPLPGCSSARTQGPRCAKSMSDLPTGISLHLSELDSHSIRPACTRALPEACTERTITACDGRTRALLQVNNSCLSAPRRTTQKYFTQRLITVFTNRWTTEKPGGQKKAHLVGELPH